MEQAQKKALPDAFCDRIKSTYSDAEEFIKAISIDPILSVRLNCSKWSDGLLDIGAPVPWCEEGRYLANRPQFTLNPAFHAGAFYVQEASSMSYSIALDAIETKLPLSPTCLDLCSAPGGKATLILSKLGRRGVVVANEVVRTRAWILMENIAKWGCPSAIVTNKTAQEISASGCHFDFIAVDAPCSGEGMFRKDDVAVAEWTPRAASDCAARQKEILQAIWPALQSGGFMIYSTCTFNPDENERNMEWAVKELGAEVLPLDMPQGVGITTVTFEGGEGYSFLPHKVKGEGFFICLLQKKTDAPSIPTTAPRRDKRTKASRTSLKETTTGREYVNDSRLFVKEDEVIAFPIDRADRMYTLTDALTPIWAGTAVCTVMTKKGKTETNPSPELPLSLSFNRRSVPCINVDCENALKFLHGDTDLKLPDGQDGWNVICYNDLPLGLIKRIGSRANNYWPKEWRIRMNLS